MSTLRLQTDWHIEIGETEDDFRFGFSLNASILQVIQ